MTPTQILAQARVFNPEISSLHLSATVYADGDDPIIRYEAYVPGSYFAGESPEELLSNIREAGVTASTKGVAA